MLHHTFRVILCDCEAILCVPKNMEKAVKSFMIIRSISRSSVRSSDGSCCSSSIEWCSWGVQLLRGQPLGNRGPCLRCKSVKAWCFGCWSIFLKNSESCKNLQLYYPVSWEYRRYQIESGEASLWSGSQWFKIRSFAALWLCCVNIVFVGAFIDCTLIALSKVQSKCNGSWEMFTLHESNKISLKNGTLSKTIEERHIKQNHWRGASSENKITLQEPHKISMKRFLFWSSFKLNEPNKINYSEDSEEVFLWNCFKLQKSNKISLRSWSMACNGPSTWVWWFTSNSKTNSINIKLKLGKFKFNHYILSKD